MVGLALQLGLTLENYLIAHDAHRRTQEYELLTEIGQAISSRLDQDEVCAPSTPSWGRFSTPATSTSLFRKATKSASNWKWRTIVLPKRSRKLENAFTEYVIHTGQPLLIRSDLEAVREPIRVRITARSIRPNACAQRRFCWATSRRE
jgi:hypothetical protein